MQPYIVISYHTPDELYTAHARACIELLDIFHIPRHIETLPPVGSWVQNCAAKPRFIQKKLAEFTDRPVVWLDVDARVMKQPVLFDTIKADFAVHYRAGVELLSNTMFFNVGPKSRQLVDLWVTEQAKNTKEWDQKVLQRVIDRDATKLGIEVQRLPAEYAAIDFMRVRDPVIVQTQASRTVRKRLRERR